MSKELWINLPVKDVKNSTDFFTKLGFSFNKQGSSENSAWMLAGTKNIAVMLFEESMFIGFSQNKLTDTKQSTEVLLTYGVESRQEVDEIAKKVKAAGGSLYGEPVEMNGMYGCIFSDLDGHRWNLLHGWE
jgi:predicted lactoylglutathione lyase